MVCGPGHGLCNTSPTPCVKVDKMWIATDFCLIDDNHMQNHSANILCPKQWLLKLLNSDGERTLPVIPSPQIWKKCSELFWVLLCDCFFACLDLGLDTSKVVSPPHWVEIATSRSSLLWKAFLKVLPRDTSTIPCVSWFWVRGAAFGKRFGAAQGFISDSSKEWVEGQSESYLKHRTTNRVKCQGLCSSLFNTLNNLQIFGKLLTISSYISIFSPSRPSSSSMKKAFSQTRTPHLRFSKWKSKEKKNWTGIFFEAHRMVR